MMPLVGFPWAWILALLMSVQIMGDSDRKHGTHLENEACLDHGGPQQDRSRSYAADICQDSNSVRDSSDRILQGIECQPRTQPWQAALFLKPDRLFCGAVLIHPQWVITAAHCKKPSYIVVLGRYCLHGSEEGQMILHGVQSFPHPNYTRPAHSNDLMLIKLNTKVTVSKSIRPIKIATKAPTVGATCIVSGWGTTNSPQVHYPEALQCLNITILSQKACQNAYPGEINSSMFCAGDEEGKDSCQGDSGGPVVCNEVLQGLVSWGDVPCGKPNRPGVYTNLCQYNQWIDSIIKKN